MSAAIPSPSDESGSSRFRITSSRGDTPGIRLKPGSSEPTKDDPDEKDCLPGASSDKNVTMPEENNTPKDAGSGAQDAPAEKKPTLPKLSDLKGKVPLKPKLKPIPPKKLDPLPEEATEAETEAAPANEAPEKSPVAPAPAPEGEVKLPPADEADKPKLPPAEKKDEESKKPLADPDRPTFVDRPTDSEPTKPKFTPAAAVPKPEAKKEEPAKAPASPPPADASADPKPAARPAIARPKVGQSTAPADEEALEEDFSEAKDGKTMSKVNLAIDIAAAVVGVAVVIFLVMDLLPLA